MPKVQAPDANPLASRASEPEARVEGSSFHAKTPWLRPGGKSNGTDETRLRTGSQFAEMPSSQSLTQLDSVTWHVTRASHVVPQVHCVLVIPEPPYAFHLCHFAFGRTRYPSSFRADHIITLSSFHGRRDFIAPEPGIGLVTTTTIDLRHSWALALRPPAVFALATCKRSQVLPAKNNAQPRNGEGKVVLLKNKRPHPKVQPFGSPRS